MSIPTTFLTEEMRQQAIGLEGPPVTTEIERGAIIRFAQAIEDDNPVFNDEEAARKSQYGGLIAPPTFLRSIRSSRREVPFDIPFNNALDVGSDWEYFEPVRPGDLITAVSRITDMQERSGRMGVMIITSTVTTYTNQFEQVVATQTTTGIRY